MADPINGSAEARNEGIEVKANDIAQQKQALKKLGGDQPPAEEAPAPKRRGRPPGSAKAFPVTAPTDRCTDSRQNTVCPASTLAGDPVDLIDKMFELAKECDGIEQVKCLVGG